MGKQQEIRPQHGCDGAAGADVRNAGIRDAAELQRHEGLQRGRGNAAQEVPDQETHPAQRVLDVVPEDPEEEHVAEDVLPARVHEHPGEDALPPGQRVHRERRRHVARALESARVVAVAKHVDVDARLRQLPEPDESIRDDQPHCDDREAPGRDVVAERDHCAASLCFAGT